jgi:hypothetical protein
MRRHFDLNIQRVLEHWTVAEACREIIANALDEQALTGTAEPEIFKDTDLRWHICDRGRGLRYEHLTQNEDPEKLRKHRLVIGKFGVGLKDALATFDRHDVSVVIQSRYSDITVENVSKHGFDDVLTLHAVVDQPSRPGTEGTEFVLSGITDNDVELAKAFFLRYSGDEELEATQYGSVLRRRGKPGIIYVNGLRVAEEPNFLFSYNITSLTKALRGALNRERSNVGRQAYSDRIKAILLQCSSPQVADGLATDLALFAGGRNHDETSTWLDVSVHACKVLNAHEKVVFVTAHQMEYGAALIGHARADGYRIVLVPDKVADRLPRVTDIEGKPMRDLAEYGQEWNASFEYDFVPTESLSAREQEVLALAEPILALAKQEARRVRQVLVSNTMRLSRYDGNEAVAVWEEADGRIIVKRSQLARPDTFIATLLHEVAHAFSGAPDLSQRFEDGLTVLLGRLGGAAVGAPRSGNGSGHRRR